MQMAKTIQKENNNEMYEIAVKSSDFHHRVAVAWAYGLALKDDACLIHLLSDSNQLVSNAARESCIHIARNKYKDFRTDFGPVLGSGPSEKNDAANLWSVYFERKEKQQKESIKNKSSNEKKNDSKSENKEKK